MKKKALVTRTPVQRVAFFGIEHYLNRLLGRRKSGQVDQNTRRLLITYESLLMHPGNALMLRAGTGPH